MRQQKHFLTPFQKSKIQTRRAQQAMLAGGMAALLFSSGCQDGPMYAMKRVNPYYTMKEWAADERLGPTDATRAEEMAAVVTKMNRWDEPTQRKWLSEIEKVMQHDANPHMRGLAVQAAANSNLPESMSILASGMRDDDFKVRMVACKALGRRTNDPEATRLLAESVNTEVNKDVRLTAIKSLGGHSGRIATDALKAAVQDADLAFQYASVVSLKTITGQDLGDEPDAWVAFLEQPEATTQEGPKQETWRERLQNFF